MIERIGLLGRGNFGEVWKEYDSYLDRFQASKHILLGVSSFGDNLDEAKLMAASESPYTVKVYGASRVGNEFVIRTEFVERGSLSDFLANGPLGLEDFFGWFPAICSGISHLHLRGILHRDIKPGNVLIDANYKAKISDFGLALVEGTSPDHATVGYGPAVPPESGVVTSVAGDIYALGCLAYRMLNGEAEWDRQARPLRGRFRNEASLARFPDRNLWPPYVSKGLRKAISKAMSVDPNSRYATVADFKRAVESVLPRFYWSALENGLGWCGQSKGSGESRTWIVEVTPSGSIETKRSINGGSFRRVTGLCQSDSSSTSMRAAEEIIRSIEKGKTYK